MGKDSAIAWTDHTFNPWWGCTKVSPGCSNCYAATFDKRVGGDNWKPNGPRRFFGDAHWREPLKWNAAAEKAGKRAKVFCASMADVCEDRPDLVEPRGRLVALVDATPWLDWLFLTKRPENFNRLMPWISTRPNAWAGATAENREQAERRVPELLRVQAAVLFISAEPLLGPVDLSRWINPVCETCSERNNPPRRDGVCENCGDPLPPELSWVIAGAESGPGARPCDVAWLRSLRNQCKDAGVPFLLKQAVVPVPSRLGFDALAEGPGSHRKGRASGSAGPSGSVLVELPYLDGVQHANFPETP